MSFRYTPRGVADAGRYSIQVQFIQNAWTVSGTLKTDHPELLTRTTISQTHSISSHKRTNWILSPQIQLRIDVPEVIEMLYGDVAHFHALLWMATNKFDKIIY